MYQDKIVIALRTQASTSLKFWVEVALVLLSVAFVWLVYEIGMQQYSIRCYMPTTAKVLNSSIKTKNKLPAITRWGAGTSTRHYPEIEYSYVINDHEYTSTNITAISVYETTDEWAAEIVCKYRLGSTVTAYYNPHFPKMSFLLFEKAFWPYQSLVECYALMCILFIICRSIGKIYKSPKPPKQILDDFYILPPNNVKTRFRYALIWCGSYYFVAVLTFILYFSLTNGNLGLYANIFSKSFLVLGILPLCYFGYDFLRYNKFESPRLVINRTHLKRGEVTRIKVIEDFKNAISLNGLKFALVCETWCEDKDRFKNPCLKSTRSYVHQFVGCQDRNVARDESIEFEDVIQIPLNAHKSGFSKDDILPFYRWYFEIKCIGSDSCEFTTKYFISCI